MFFTPDTGPRSGRYYYENLRERGQFIKFIGFKRALAMTPKSRTP